MRALGDHTAAEVTMREINTPLDDVAKRGVAPRTVNCHRQLVCAIFSYGCQARCRTTQGWPPTAAQDAELVRVAAYSGLRRGELVALHWRDVDFERHKIVVAARSAPLRNDVDEERRMREIPLPQPGHAIHRLSQRDDFTSPTTRIVNRLGRRIDGSALRKGEWTAQRRSTDPKVRIVVSGRPSRPLGLQFSGSRTPAAGTRRNPA